MDIGQQRCGLSAALSQVTKEGQTDSVSDQDRVPGALECVWETNYPAEQITELVQCSRLLFFFPKYSFTFINQISSNRYVLFTKSVSIAN